MTDRRSRQRRSPGRESVPGVQELESRCLLSTGYHPLGHHRLVTALRMGEAVQTGTVVTVSVNKPTTNTVQVSEGGPGNIQVAWNGGPLHSFTGVGTTIVQAEKARRDQVTFNLDDPATGSPDLAVHHGARTEAVPAGAMGHPMIPAGKGVTVQNGTELSVTVGYRKGNTLQVTDEGGGAVQISWQGGAVHSFTRVATIVVQAEKARNDQITFDSPLT
jgi:hypothetical protein